MALTTYTELKASVADFLNRSDLTSAIPDFITLAEARIKRIVRTAQVQQTTVSVAADDTSFAIPATVLALVTVSVEDSVRGGPLTIVSYPELLKLRTQWTTAGIPRFGAVVGSTVYFTPAADATYAMAIEYEGPFTALSGSNASNYLLTNHPDLYLYGTLAESAPYLKDDDRIMVWAGRFDKAVEEMESHRERWRWPAPVNVPVPSTFADSPPGY